MSGCNFNNWAVTVILGAGTPSATATWTDTEFIFPPEEYSETYNRAVDSVINVAEGLINTTLKNSNSLLIDD